MKASRLIVAAVALLAAIGAGYLAMEMSREEAPEPVIITTTRAEPPIKLTEVLVTRQELPMGAKVDGALAWQKWPEDGVNPTLILRNQRPGAIDELQGSVARSNFFAGEPIREAKLIKTDRGFMSAVLPAGKRAVAVRITADTSAGGFILPNDHVDVIMTYEQPSANSGLSGTQFQTETVLHNLRVLAIDQTIEERDGTQVVVGSTATLEVDPDQAEALTAAQRLSDRLVLSLRSLADSVPGSPGYAAFLLAREQEKRGKIKLVRYGNPVEITTR